MSGIATAVIGGAVISSVVGAKSASDASDAQTQSADASVAEQQRQFDIAQANMQPFQDAGEAALASQQDLLGLNGVAAQQSAYDTLETSPGQAFLQERAQKNLLSNAAAIGGLGGGNVREALVEQGVGFAQTDMDNQFSRLGQIAGQGQSSASTISSLGTQTGANIGSTLTSAGDARASGIINTNNAIQSGISGVTSGLAQSGLFGSGSSYTNTQATNTNPFARYS